MIWLDRHGQGLLIRDFGEDDTKYLPDLRDREYFQVWQRDYPASRRPPPLPDSGALLLNTSRVWSVLRWGRQGEKGAVLTVPGWLGHKGQAEPILGLYATQLTCLTNPILPPGFSFCVLDGQGNVQFHSDDRLSLSENLLQDGEPGSTISAALLSQVPTQASIYYQGHRYRMRLEPMRADQGYFLLVLADEENLRSRQLHILVRAALLLGGGGRRHAGANGPASAGPNPPWPPAAGAQRLSPALAAAPPPAPLRADNPGGAGRPGAAVFR